MKKIDTVKKILLNKKIQINHSLISVYAPSNIAICKYWGKRDEELNLPCNSSLSISLGDRGAKIQAKVIDAPEDILILNNEMISQTNPFAKSAIAFINLFRTQKKFNLKIETTLNIPLGAGLASSACIFAALTKAINDLLSLELTDKELSILGRLGSGSACRSFWHGFVEWHMGTQRDGMDSYASPLPSHWKELRIGLLILSTAIKEISSREAMRQTVATSTFYKKWIRKVNADLILIKNAIRDYQFTNFGKVAESNAMAMHATMHTANPPIVYSLPQTLALKQKISELRKSGLEIYFTQDAGPNLKLLFLEKDKMIIQEHFPEVIVINPFDKFEFK